MAIYVQPSGKVHQRNYDINFQVWRPSNTVKHSECYSLVGENRFTSIVLGDSGLVNETPEPSDTISVQPGDVVGYYSFSQRDPESLDHDGIRLDHSVTGNSMWYHGGRLNAKWQYLIAPNCPFPIRTGADKILKASTDVRPVLTVSISK